MAAYFASDLHLRIPVAVHIHLERAASAELVRTGDPDLAIRPLQQQVQLELGRQTGANEHDARAFERHAPRFTGFGSRPSDNPARIAGCVRSPPSPRRCRLHWSKGSPTVRHRCMRRIGWCAATRCSGASMRDWPPDSHA